MIPRFFHEYRGSQKVAADVYKLTQGNEFYTLIMAAARFADTDNFELLAKAFPEVIEELQARYKAPGGALNEVELDILKRSGAV